MKKILNKYNITQVLKNTPKIKIFKISNKNTKTTRVLKLVKAKTKDFRISYYKKEIIHDNIIKCFKIIKKIIIDNDKYIGFVLEYADMGNINENVNYFYNNKRNVLSEILSGLQHLHNNNIIHGDLKPSNILLLKSNNSVKVKLSDYETLHLKYQKQLTPEYAPPEWKQNKTKQYDIWSVGCIIYQLFNNKPPFGSSKKGLTIDSILNNICHKPISKKIFNIPEPYRYITFKCLQKKKEKRFYNTTEIIELLTKKTTFFKRLNYKVQYLKAIINGEIE